MLQVSSTVKETNNVYMEILHLLTAEQWIQKPGVRRLYPMIIIESTTVALSSGRNNKERLIAVFVLGGGAFDVSILEIFNGVIEVFF
ncbi:hypothetical protein MKW98_002877 [Papaver atlanticum]|uniref:Uncharacterized protein n=1 Tax=Papaver atlanticum TaxID=357466 RepID=A0AAD4TCP1_9MAGN|nr:hypothetical protein MKW98_002877 [Papaver atlanticum]